MAYPMLERKRTASGSLAVILTECPICETPLGEQARTADHISDHTPSEVGL